MENLRDSAPCGGEYLEEDNFAEINPESEKQSGDTVPLEQSIDIGTIPMVHEQNPIPLDQNTDIGTAPSVPDENTILLDYGLEVGIAPSVPEESTMPYSTGNPMKKSKSARAKLIKLHKKYKKLKRIVKKLREWLKEEDKAWKPKKETDIAETQTEVETQTVETQT